MPVSAVKIRDILHVRMPHDRVCSCSEALAAQHLAFLEIIVLKIDAMNLSSCFIVELYGLVKAYREDPLYQES